VFDILTRSTSLSGIRHQRAALAEDRVDLLLHPPLPAIGALDFKAGVSLVEVGYRHTVEELARSGLAKRFMALAQRHR
jgi:predicted acylesterase/phospholipase RssA